MTANNEISKEDRKAILKAHFSKIGARGGSVTSDAKAEAARQNAKHGGRPVKKPRSGTMCHVCRTEESEVQAVRFRNKLPLCQDHFDAALAAKAARAKARKRAKSKKAKILLAKARKRARKQKAKLAKIEGKKSRRARKHDDETVAAVA